MSKTNIETERTPENCGRFLLPIKDALDVLNGKWRLLIIGSLTFGSKRFRELARGIPGITDKMLSKELKDLEMNKLINRTVHDAYPPVVEYSITEHGRTLNAVLQELHRWGKRASKKDYRLTERLTECINLIRQQLAYISILKTILSWLYCCRSPSRFSRLIFEREKVLGRNLYLR